MARQLNRLTAVQARTLGPGRHSDGGGLYLCRDYDGRSRWVFMWKRAAKRREMGLGFAGPGGLSLANARVAAGKAREVVQGGGDPIKARDAEQAAPAPIPTFGEVADAFVSDLSPQWRNSKHRAQWAMTLRHYAAPLRSLPVDSIDTKAVLETLKSVWTTKPETASRLRGRIERVLDAARAQGHRTGENPARWRGHLDHLLPKRQKLTRGHHAAMAYEDVPAFMGELRASRAVSTQALEFLILTAARSGEVLGAAWDEMDLDAKVWTVPAHRMKAGREHRVPLGDRAVELLRAAEAFRTGVYVFPGQRPGKPLSGMALEMTMRRLKRDAFTVHGFRSSFRDWAGEVSTFPREVAEAALAHTIGDATERAYRRGDALEKRRKLMDAWAEYLARDSRAGNVLPMGRRGAR